MFCTIISEAYEYDEQEKIYEYIDDICSPRDTYGWSSNGIYCYWNYNTKEILYIGLARNLGERFKQHNGLISCDSRSCKIKEIEQYFRENKKIGFSIIVQSPLFQMKVSRNSEISAFSLDEEQNEEYRKNLAEIEGKLIQGHTRRFGEIPKWNKINGELGCFPIIDSSIFDYLTLRKDSFLNARISLREISENPEYAYYEMFLHAIRHRNLNRGESISMKEIIEDFKKIYNKMYSHSSTIPYDKIYEYINKKVSL